MGVSKVDLDAEEAVFQKDIEKVNAWWKTPRHANLKRPYSAQRVASLRPSILTEYPASRQARKLWDMLQKHNENGTYELTYGITDTIMAAEMARYQNTVYVSGSMCGVVATDQPGADHADYPWDTVPKVVGRIYRSQEWNDQLQRQFRLLKPKEERDLQAIDHLAPIIADGDMGFGPLTSTMKMAKTFVEAGVAMIHVDDLAMGLKKFTIGQGRTLVPMSEYEARLSAVRLQFDIMGADTMILSRSDCIKAQFLTSVIDPRDHEYVLGATKSVKPFSEAQLHDIELGQNNTTTTRDNWTKSAGLMTFDQAVKAECSSEAQYTAYEAKIPNGSSLAKRREAAREILCREIFFDWELPRSIQGQYMYQWCTKAVIERQLAVAPVSDVSWPRMDYPDENLISNIYSEVTKHYPNRLFCYGYTNSYDWEGNGYSYEDIKNFPSVMAKYGAVFQIQPVWAAQGIRAYTAESCKILKEDGMAGYVEKIQKPAMKNAIPGSGMINHGAYLADAYLDAIMARDA